MADADAWPRRRLPAFPSALLFGSVLLRSVILNRSGPALVPVLALLAIWLVAAAGEPVLSRRWPSSVHANLTLQAVVALVLMTGLPLANFDYFALLYFTSSMQAMQHLPVRLGVTWIAVFTLLTAFPLFRGYGFTEGVGFVLIYTAGNVLLGSYALATRRAESARLLNGRLASDLEKADGELADYASRLEALAATRERHHLGRELHDSVTQTVFGMNLSAQSALLLLEREPGRVAAQLDHLAQMAKSALAQMQMLIAELRPKPLVTDGLAAAVRWHLEERALPEGLTFSVRAEGDLRLDPQEEEGLFCIAREAIHNVVKHASASHARLSLHLEAPPWMEIADDGCGFCGRSEAGGVGLTGMRERATEIGWDLEVDSTPGRGTRIRATRHSLEGRTP